VEYDRIVSEAKDEADRILENARKQADEEQEKSVRQAREQIAELVVAATAKVVASGQGQEADRELYNRFLAKTGEQ
jgi:F-type H+-transporting ATPase subunit b